MCNTYNSNNNKLIKNATTPQSSNAESNNIRGLWCPCMDNEDTITVITMQMQATRIDLLLAPSGLSHKECCLADWWSLWILDEGEKEEQRCGLKLEWISESEYTQILRHVLNLNCRSI